MLCAARAKCGTTSRTLTAWEPAPGTRSVCSLPQLAQITGSFRKGQGRKPGAGGGEKEAPGSEKGAGQAGGQSLQMESILGVPEPVTPGNGYDLCLP